MLSQTQISGTSMSWVAGERHSEVCQHLSMSKQLLTSESGSAGNPLGVADSFNDCFLLCATFGGPGNCTAFTYSGGANGVGPGTCYFKNVNSNWVVGTNNLVGGEKGLCSPLLLRLADRISLRSSHPIRELQWLRIHIDISYNDDYDFKRIVNLQSFARRGNNCKLCLKSNGYRTAS